MARLLLRVIGEGSSPRREAPLGDGGVVLPMDLVVRASS
jgi:hypothetical protein